MVAEERQRKLNTLREAYINAIRQDIERNWYKPDENVKMPLCEVLIEQGPGGIILNVSFGACDGGTPVYRKSIENAVWKADPLPSPADPELFERKLKLEFKPITQ
jgi:colicin import membrane protein